MWSGALSPLLQRARGATEAGAPDPAPDQGLTPAAEAYRPWQAARPSPIETVPLAPMWGVAGNFAGALFGPPYDLPDATVEWQVRADTMRDFHQGNRAARMALRVHPNGPHLQTAGSFVSRLYDLTPTPDYVGIGVDFAS